MTNKAVCEAYAAGNVKSAVACHCGFYGDYFYSYSTLIAVIDRNAKTVFVNSRKYSHTTGRQKSALMNALYNAGYTVYEFIGQNANYWNMGYQGAENLKEKDVFGFAFWDSRSSWLPAVLQAATIQTV